MPPHWCLLDGLRALTDDAFEVSGALQGIAHAAAVVGLATLANSLHVGAAPGHWADVWVWLGWLLVVVGVPGGIIGAFIFGLNLLITCRWFKLNDNDAFSALRLDTYRNFLRIRIAGDDVTIYPIGLDRVPRRQEWQLNPNASAKNSEETIFLPSHPLMAHLIEQLILVRR